MTLAEWLAAPAPWPAGQCAASGVLSVEVMLADGIEECLGPFGEADVQPLRSATVQSLVPELFKLASGGDAFATHDGHHWLGRYRLDALKPEAPATVNLAHLLLGHGGTLAWVQSVTLTDAPASRRRARRRNRPGWRRSGWTGASRRCSTPMVVFPYSCLVKPDIISACCKISPLVPNKRKGVADVSRRPSWE